MYIYIYMYINTYIHAYIRIHMHVYITIYIINCISGTNCRNWAGKLPAVLAPGYFIYEYIPLKKPKGRKSFDP